MFAWLLQLFLFVLFSIVIGIFVSVLFRSWFPCAQCAMYERNERILKEASKVKASYVEPESEVE